jgi:hypothetical protein
MNTDVTGPWGLDDLEHILGKSANGGREYGQFPFRCGCVAEKGGVNGDLYLSPCTVRHRSLKPSWTAVKGAHPPRKHVS